MLVTMAAVKHNRSHGKYYGRQRWKFWGGIVLIPLMADLFGLFLHFYYSGNAWLTFGFIFATAACFVAGVAVCGKFTIDRMA